MQIDFDQLRVMDPKQKELRDRVKAVPTLWTINAENRAAIEQAGQLLLHQQPCFQHLLLDLGIKRDFIEEDFAKKGCAP